MTNKEAKINKYRNPHPELLSPAGDYESLIGAFNAGADAVYLAGDKYGARAYASNFSQEELVQAIKYAHLLNRKIYLAVNTLVKNKELDGIYDFLHPYYMAGLDAVIVQDLGVFYFILHYFPDLEIHISTQMTITGTNGSFLVKELGASRVVPARELTLEEIQNIRKNCDIEIETFIHGAMCYSYSGACLFSSILGGRSGNRGRCAQPCRLPYKIENNKNSSNSDNGEQYCLSLKDMCTIDLVPDLIEGGIDSFKIEGRMKKPEYTAGVTSVYRKYMDQFNENPDVYQVTPDDQVFLEQLYTRSKQQNGYYKKHNGKEMITETKPSYNGVDDVVLQKIREQYLEKSIQIPAFAKVELVPGEPIQCTLECNGKVVCVSGDIVQKAEKRPVSKEDIIKQIKKTGTTNFTFEEIEVILSPDSFIPLKSINEIRREALILLEEKLLNQQERRQVAFPDEAILQLPSKSSPKRTNSSLRTQYAVSVASSNQFQEVLKYEYITRIYIPSDLLLIKEYAFEYCNHPLWHQLSKWDGEIHIILPAIMRDVCFGLEDNRYESKLLELLSEKCVSGYLVKNMDSLGFLLRNNLMNQNDRKIVTADAGIYTYNYLSKKLLEKYINTYTIPYELNLAELLNLGLEGMEIPVYGRIPMMVTANCIKKTSTGCDIGKRSEYYDFSKTNNKLFLSDRYQVKFPVVCDCSHCFNIIYNSVPISLHQYMGRFEQENPHSFRIDLTIESAAESNEILHYFEKIHKDIKNIDEPPYRTYTKGHLARGVE